MAYDRELGAVLRWLDRSDGIALEGFRPGVPFETKADGTPVTALDRRIEEVLRGEIARTFPGDAVLGEEGGASGDGERRWIIDPIDGTQSYARGIPAFATLVALEEGGRAVVGAASAPALGSRWWAAAGGGAFRDGAPIRASGVSRLEEAQVASGGVASLRRAGILPGFLALSERAARHRGYADFWGHVLVAQGSMDVMVEPAASAWDLAAVAVIVQEAGGRLSGLGGEPRFDTGAALTTNGLLHEEVLALLAAGGGPAP